jgi:AcrR family transcriptional regulator
VPRVRLPAKAGLHDEIIRVSIQLGSELGEDGLTMRAIAARLGVSATALYQHFESKGAILREIRMLGIRTLLERQQDAGRLPNPRDRVHGLARSYIEFAMANPWLYRLLFVEDEVPWSTLTEEERELLVAPLRQSRAALRAGVDEGEFLPETDVELAALGLWAAVHGLACMLIAGRISETHPAFGVSECDEFVGSFIDGVLNGFTPRT